MNIVVLSTYPPQKAAHGGQHRLKNIVRALVASGHQVQCCGILGSESYPPTQGYLRYPGNDVLRRYLSNVTLMEDWAIGQYAADDHGGFKNLSNLINPKVDLIFCEQPWLFAYAKKLSQKINPRKPPILFYGSQNIEYQLKHDIVKAYIGNNAAVISSDLVLEVERYAIQNSDITFCVSEEDTHWVAQYSSRTPILASNGVVDRRGSLDDITQSNRITQGRKFALYCASGHPPNIDGFFEIFGQGVGCFAPEERFVIAGAAGACIRMNSKYPSTSGLGPILIDAGVVSEAVLRGLLATAHVVVLPITKGGGTNLKAAEAIWSGAHIVATNKAMRGFESFIGDKGIIVVDNNSSFCRAIQMAMASPPCQLTPEDREKRSAVLWDETLSPLTRAVNALETYQ